jgi:hypothetical protein
MWFVALLAVFIITVPASAAPPPVATYLFNDTFTAVESFAPALVPVDPLGLSAFEDSLVFGTTRRVYRFDGNLYPVEEQAGLSLATAGLIPYNAYSVELVFEFTEINGAWRRIIDVNNRTSDNGFYVEPGDRLQIWENGGLSTGTAVFTTNQFHHVVLTNDSAGIVKAYLDGVLEFTTPSTTVMNINNPDAAMNFFLDNFEGGGQGEFADGRVALVRVYDAILSDGDVAALAQNPFPVIIDVAIDIKPGSFPNGINLGSQGVVPVAILSTESFDASSVDPASITLAGAAVRLKGKGTPMASLEDVNADGRMDLVVQVNTGDLQLLDTDTTAVLEGKTLEGAYIRGADSVRTVPQ